MRRVVQSLILLFPPRGHFGGAPFEIFNFYLLLHYVADYVETLQSDTRHWCKQSLSPRFCDFFQGGAPFKIFNLYLPYYVAEWVEIFQNDTRH